MKGIDKQGGFPWAEVLSEKEGLVDEVPDIEGDGFGDPLRGAEVVLDGLADGGVEGLLFEPLIGDVVGALAGRDLAEERVRLHLEAESESLEVRFAVVFVEELVGDLEVDKEGLHGEGAELTELVVGGGRIAMEEKEDAGELVLVASDGSFGMSSGSSDLSGGVASSEEIGDGAFVAWLGPDIFDGASGGYGDALVAESMDELFDGGDVDSEEDGEVLVGEEPALCSGLSAVAEDAHGAQFDGALCPLEIDVGVVKDGEVDGDDSAVLDGFTRRFVLCDGGVDDDAWVSEVTEVGLEMVGEQFKSDPGLGRVETGLLGQANREGTFGGLAFVS